MARLESPMPKARPLADHRLAELEAPLVSRAEQGHVVTPGYPVSIRPSDENGCELALYLLDPGLDLKTLQLLGSCRDLRGLLRRAVDREILRT